MRRAKALLYLSCTPKKPTCRRAHGALEELARALAPISAPSDTSSAPAGPPPQDIRLAFFGHQNSAPRW